MKVEFLKRRITVGKVIRWLDKNFEEFIMSFALWAIVVVMFLQVIMRYVFRASIFWSEELSRYCFIWFAFMGMSHGAYANSHIRLDFIKVAFPKLERHIDLIGDLLFLIFTIYMIKPGINVMNLLMVKAQPSPAMGIPMHFIYVSLLIGIILALLRIIQRYYIKYFRTGGKI